MRRLVFASLLVGPIGLLFPTSALADSSFNVKVEAPAAQKAHKGMARIHITPGPGFHVNKEYPASARVVAPAGVTVDKDKLPPSAVAETALDFEIPYTPNE